MTTVNTTLRALALVLLVAVSEASAGTDYSLPQTLTPAHEGTDSRPAFATDGSGTWVIVWITNSAGENTAVAKSAIVGPSRSLWQPTVRALSPHHRPFREPAKSRLENVR